ncbi:MAG TPA: HAD-IA family hydrolase [Nitrospiria bacterium]|nr:HAD-IA family hydrolase [Nitrospiria bacterium]
MIRNNSLVDWREIDHILLDMDGTLLDKEFDDYFWEELVPLEYAKKHALPFERAREELLSRYRQYLGELAWTDLDFWSRELDIDIPRLKEDASCLIGLDPTAIDFLQFLKGLKKSVSLVTNAHWKTIEIKLRKTNIDEHLDRIISAFDIGMPKEKVLFWERLRQRIGFEKEKTLLIDDNEDVLRSAREYGLRYILQKAQTSIKDPSQSTTDFNSITDFSGLME